MHCDELWQVYHPNGQPIVGKRWGAALGDPELTGASEIVGGAMVFLYRWSNNGLELLWQKRSEKTNRWPGDYDISAGGHIKFGESVEEAATREADEEIGIKISVQDLQFVAMRAVNKNRFVWVYLVDFTGKEEDFKFNDEEVSEVRWVPFAEFDEFRLKYAKPSLKEDDLTFECIKEWFLQRENS